MCSLLPRHASRAKSAMSAFSRVEIVSLDDFRRFNALQYQLCYSITFLDRKIHCREVEQHDANGTSIIGVDHARAHVDEVLHGQTTARCCSIEQKKSRA